MNVAENSVRIAPEPFSVTRGVAVLARFRRTEVDACLEVAPDRLIAAEGRAAVDRLDAVSASAQAFDRADFEAGLEIHGAAVRQLRSAGRLRRALVPHARCVAGAL